MAKHSHKDEPEIAGDCIRFPYPQGSFIGVTGRLRGSIIKAVLPHVILTTLLSTIITILYHFNAFDWGDGKHILPRRAHIALLIPLAFLLIFRSSIGVSRYWAM